MGACCSGAKSSVVTDDLVDRPSKKNVAKSGKPRTPKTRIPLPTTGPFAPPVEGMFKGELVHKSPNPVLSSDYEKKLEELKSACLSCSYTLFLVAVTAHLTLCSEPKQPTAVPQAGRVKARQSTRVELELFPG